MSNTLIIEAQIMYDHLKEIDEPKEALEKLATLEGQMGWNIHPERIRALAYGMWLNEKRPDWYPYFEKLIEVFSAIASANLVNLSNMGEIPEAPEGWIAPVQYFKGKVVE